MFPIRDTIPSRTFPFITLMLIAVNIAVFFYELLLPEKELDALVHLWGVIPARYTLPEYAAANGFPPMGPLPFFTSMFLHGGWMHLIGNMWSLWLFGDNVEDRLGHGRFLVFYLACGLTAGLAHVALHPHSMIPTIGASGAIAGVMGAYFILYPFARIVVVMPVFFYPIFFELPAVIYLFFWFLSQLYSGALALSVGKDGFGGVAFWAHAGGFVAGIALLGVFTAKKGVSRRRIQ